MFHIDSNAESVFLRLQRNLENADLDLQDNLRRAGLDAVAVVAHRVQQQGLDSNNSRMISPAQMRSGAYSAGYAKLRQKLGRQIGHVDLTLHGDLFRSWQVVDLDRRQVTVGFLDDRQADKAEKLESYYGPVFFLTQQEQETITEGIAKRLLDDISR